MSSTAHDLSILATVCCVTVLSVSSSSVAFDHALTIQQVFLSGATGVSIATIGKDLNFKQEDLQWPLNVYA